MNYQMKNFPIIFYPLLLPILFLSTNGCFKTKNMKKDFCTCLIENNSDCLKSEVNAFLATVNNLPKETALENFKQWLSQKECVKKVEMSAAEIETRIPLKEFHLDISTPKDGLITKTLTLKLDPKGIVLNQF